MIPEIKRKRTKKNDEIPKRTNKGFLGRRVCEVELFCESDENDMPEVLLRNELTTRVL